MVLYPVLLSCRYLAAIVRSSDRTELRFHSQRLTGASFPRRGQSLRYRLDRWPPLQANTSQLPVLHSPYNLILSQGSEVRSVLPDGHVISSRHAGWGSSGWIDFPCPVQSVCQWHALTLASRQFGPLCRWHGRHSHVLQADAAASATWRELHWGKVVTGYVGCSHRCSNKEQACTSIMAVRL